MMHASWDANSKPNVDARLRARSSKALHTGNQRGVLKQACRLAKFGP